MQGVGRGERPTASVVDARAEENREWLSDLIRTMVAWVRLPRYWSAPLFGGLVQRLFIVVSESSQSHRLSELIILMFRREVGKESSKLNGCTGSAVMTDMTGLSISAQFIS